jgi:hypothetical protein
VSQVSRGLNLVLKQVREKHQKYISSSAKMIHVVAVFSQIATKMEAMLQLNLQKLTSSTDPSTSAAEDTEQEKQTILSEALSNLNELKAYFKADGLLDKIQANGLSHSGSATSSTSKGISRSSGTQTKTSASSASVAEESTVQVYERIHCSNGATVKKAMVGGSECWVLSSVASLNDSEMPFLEITLPHPVHLSAVTLQGGIAPLAMQQQLQQQQQQDPSAAAQAKGSLPCGLGFDDCNGSVENTVKLLGDVISWETLIKKNSPEKFLARPPVRFLFDLINLVTRVSNLSVYQSTEETSWEIVGNNKESKMAFIDKVCLSSLLCLFSLSPYCSPLSPFLSPSHRSLHLFPIPSVSHLPQPLQQSSLVVMLHKLISSYNNLLSSVTLLNNSSLSTLSSFPASLLHNSLLEQWKESRERSSELERIG